jgi:hypothetical protein
MEVMEAGKVPKNMIGCNIKCNKIKAPATVQGLQATGFKFIIYNGASDLPKDNTVGAKLGNTFPVDDVVAIIGAMYSYYKNGPEKRKYYGMPDNFFVVKTVKPAIIKHKFSLEDVVYKNKEIVDTLRIMKNLNLVYSRYYHGNRYWKLTRQGKKFAELLESL